jgi:hypothetical protein
MRGFSSALLKANKTYSTTYSLWLQRASRTTFNSNGNPWNDTSAVGVLGQTAVICPKDYAYIISCAIPQISGHDYD